MILVVGANRTELRKVQGLKKLLTVLDHTSPQVVVLALQCISNCLDDGTRGFFDYYRREASFPFF
jgi:hypothetical protein